MQIWGGSMKKDTLFRFHSQKWDLLYFSEWLSRHRRKQTVCSGLPQIRLTPTFITRLIIAHTTRQVSDLPWKASVVNLHNQTHYVIEVLCDVVVWRPGYSKDSWQVKKVALRVAAVWTAPSQLSPSRLTVSSHQRPVLERKGSHTKVTAEYKLRQRWAAALFVFLASVSWYWYIDLDTGSRKILFLIPILFNLFYQKIALHILMVSPVFGCTLVFFLQNTTVQPINNSTIRSWHNMHAAWYWLTDADENNSFGHSMPSFDTWYILILDRIETVQLVP